MNDSMSTAQRALGLKRKGPTTAEQAQATLERDYVTLAEAVEMVRERYPEYEFSRKQLERAVNDQNLSCVVVGRLRYVPIKELDWYMGRLAPTKTNPRKLRLRPRTPLFRS